MKSMRQMLGLDKKNEAGKGGSVAQMTDQERRGRYVEWATKQQTDGTGQRMSYADWVKAGEPED